MRLVRSILWLAFCPFLMVVRPTQASPRLFFYPLAPEVDGKVLPGSPVTINVDQATINSPLPVEAAGLVVVLPWSLLCPKAFTCDVSMISRIVDYWRARGRQIVLGVETVGYPMRLSPEALNVVTATPTWVLNQVVTYYADVRVLGARNPHETARVAFPSYGDPHFLMLIRDLIAKLASLDGNPGIAELRVGPGLTTEDNPSPGGGKWLFGGFRDSDWLHYCERLLDLYRAAFHRTRLEFDVGFTGLAATRGNSVAADALIATMITDKVFLAFDGLSDRTVTDLTTPSVPRDWLSQDILYLLRARRAGLPIGLEFRAPLTAPDMQNIKKLADAVTISGAQRVVFFPFEAAALNVTGPATAELTAARKWIAAQTDGVYFAEHIRKLVKMLSLAKS